MKLLKKFKSCPYKSTSTCFVGSREIIDLRDRVGDYQCSICRYNKGNYSSIFCEKVKCIADEKFEKKSKTHKVYVLETT